MTPFARLIAFTRQAPLVAWTGLAIVPFALIILLSFRSCLLYTSRCV